MTNANKAALEAMGAAVPIFDREWCGIGCSYRYDGRCLLLNDDNIVWWHKEALRYTRCPACVAAFGKGGEDG